MKQTNKICGSLILCLYIVKTIKSRAIVTEPISIDLVWALGGTETQVSMWYHSPQEVHSIQEVLGSSGIRHTQ